MAVPGALTSFGQTEEQVGEEEVQSFAISLTLIAMTFCFCSSPAAEEGKAGICGGLPEMTAQPKIGSPQDPLPLEEASPGKSLRYKRILRDLDDEYQRGGLTKTEYIQRRRELDDLER